MHAQVEYGVAQERKEMERRVGVADSARAQADKITKNCEVGVCTLSPKGIW